MLAWHILPDFDADREYAEMLLKAKIKKGINKRYLETINGNLYIGDNNEVCGRIDYLEDNEDSVFNGQLLIDGKRYQII